MWVFFLLVHILVSFACTTVLLHSSLGLGGVYLPALIEPIVRTGWNNFSSSTREGKYAGYSDRQNERNIYEC
jgi:hypothetical protein